MHRQGTLKRRWHESFYAGLLTPPPPLPPLLPSVTVASSSSPPPFTARKAQTSPQIPRLKGLLLGGDNDLALQNVVPAVTVVVEGRSICYRINLHHHANYQSLAKALRHMFLNYCGDDDRKHNHDEDHNQVDDDEGLDLANAVPGHLVAYEDLENDLLLAGDLSWKMESFLKWGDKDRSQRDKNFPRSTQELSLCLHPNAHPHYIWNMIACCEIVLFSHIYREGNMTADQMTKDFVRVAKRIRILPVKSNSRKQRIINSLSKSLEK